MDKIKKFLAIPLACHVALFIALAVLHTNALAMMLITFDLLLGALVTPMYFAVLSMAHAIVHDGKVYDYIYACLIYLAVIGVARGLVYFVCGGALTGVAAAAGCLVISVGVFTLWDCLFALTDRMMKKKPGKKRK